MGDEKIEDKFRPHTSKTKRITRGHPTRKQLLPDNFNCGTKVQPGNIETSCETLTTSNSKGQYKHSISKLVHNPCSVDVQPHNPPTKLTSICN